MSLQLCGDDKPFVERSRLNRHHTWCKAVAINSFRSRRRVQGSDKKRPDHYLNQLSNDIDRLYDSYVRKNSAKVFVSRNAYTDNCCLYINFISSWRQHRRHIIKVHNTQR